MYDQKTGEGEHCMFRVGVVLSGRFLAKEVTGRLVQNTANTAGGENGSNALSIWKTVGSISPVENFVPVSYTHLTLPTIYSV